MKLGRRPVLDGRTCCFKYPDAVEKCRRNRFLHEWNYGWKPNYFGDISKVERKGFELWGAASLRCHPDNYSGDPVERHFDNLRDFVPYARSHGYQGMFLILPLTSVTDGFEWDHGSEVVEMYPVRRAYPLVVSASWKQPMPSR